MTGQNEAMRLDVDSDDEVGDLEYSLGFVEPPRRRSDLFRHRFPSKVGGAPAWLDPVHLPSSDVLVFRGKGVEESTSLRFLLQIYAARDDVGPDAFHRSLYLFVHPNGRRLTEPGAVRALRCQLPRENAFYSFDPPAEGDVLPRALSVKDEEHAEARDPWHVAAAEKRRRQAGELARRAAGRGDDASARGDGDDEDRASLAAAPAPGSSSLLPGVQLPSRPVPTSVPTFPEFELLVEPEPEEDAEAASATLAAAERAHRQRLEAPAAISAEDGPEETEEEAADTIEQVETLATNEQRCFAAFQARIATAPDQVLRYCGDEGARPLLATPGEPPAPPPCPRCGASRRFEFQVMPQLLSYLEQNDEDPDALDWATIAVYTCSKSCSIAGGDDAYAEEHVWLQPPIG